MTQAVIERTRTTFKEVKMFRFVGRIAKKKLKSATQETFDVTIDIR